MIALSTAPAAAHDYRAADIVIGHPHAAPPATGKPIEVGLALVDRGAEPDRLVAVTSSAASDVRLCDAEHAEASGIDLEPGRPIALKPGRMHIHVEGLQTNLATHSKMPLTLTFARAGTVEVQVLIEAEVSH